MLKSNSKTIDEYINQYPDKIKITLNTIYQTIKKIAPKARETIKYGIPTFELNGNLVHFAAYKNHIGFYPTPSAINKFKKELKKYNLSKGTIKFPINEPLPLPLIVKIVKFRVDENLSKKLKISK